MQNEEISTNKNDKEYCAMIEIKDNLLENIKDISTSLNNSNNFIEFLDKENQDTDISDSQYRYVEKFGKFGIFFFIKGLSILLFTSHLVSIYVINGLIKAIVEELTAAAKS